MGQQLKLWIKDYNKFYNSFSDCKAECSWFPKLREICPDAGWFTYEGIDKGPLPHEQTLGERNSAFNATTNASELLPPTASPTASPTTSSPTTSSPTAPPTSRTTTTHAWTTARTCQDAVIKKGQRRVWNRNLRS